MVLANAAGGGGRFGECCPRTARSGQFEALALRATRLVGRDEEMELLLRPLGACEGRQRTGSADFG